jgi:copper chaperone CopZ
MKRILLKIEGMNCPGCARKIAFFLEQAGARGVTVSRETGEAVLTVPEGEIPENFVSLVEEVGHYRVVDVVELA